MDGATETLAALVRRYCDETDEPRDVPRVSFAQALDRGDDPLHLLPYLAGLGLTVRSLNDLLLINNDEAEEEIRAFSVVEGVAVVVASDGLWVLFEP